MTDIRKKAALALLALGLIPVQSMARVKTSSKPTARGARTPFITHEAESPANRLKGSRVAMSGLPRGDDSKPEMEASGRSFVQLSAVGDFIEFSRVRAANTIVIRHCIPDAPAGGGTSASLSLYVNGKKRQKLTLSSRHAWLYGEAGQNGQSNDPTAGQPHVFWDEARSFISGAVRAGDTIRLQKDVEDSAQFYRLDLVDLEATPPPLKPPAVGSFLSVAAFGASGRDTTDDSAAIQKCIDTAKAQKKIVWMPAGTYHQSTKFTLDGVEVRGAGMWHTHLIGMAQSTDWSGNVGFGLQGDGPKVSHLSVDSTAHTSRAEGGKPFTGDPSNWRIDNVWITHTNTGLWLDGRHGVVRNSRVRFTYADAINLNNDASYNLVEHNHIRGCGDDGIALLSETERKKTWAIGNTVRFNTVSAIWWGHNADIAGGNGHLIEDNIFVDNAKMGAFTINQPGAYAMYPLKDTVIRRNSIIRGGGNFAWQERGSVWIYPGSTTISNVLFEDNEILDAAFRAIHFTGSHAQTITFKGNLITRPGKEAIFFDNEATGTTTFLNNVLRDLPQEGKAVVNNSKTPLKIVQNGNSWQ